MKILPGERFFLLRSKGALLSLLLLPLSFPPGAAAATRTWNGSTSANWGDAANWTAAGAPANGDTLVFPAGAARPTNTNNLTSLVLAEVRFTGPSGGYAIWGNALSVTNRIEATNSAGGNAIMNNITLATADLGINVATNATLTLHGDMSGSGGVTKLGPGTLVYDPANWNSYSGTTRVQAGTLILEYAYDYDGGLNGPLVIGDGSGTGAPTVRLGIDTMIPDHIPITINAAGLLDLNGFNEYLGTDLVLTGGTVQTGTATLTL